MHRIMAILAAIMLMAGSVLAAGSGSTERFEFAGVDRIVLEGTSGNIVIRQSDKNTGVVKLRYDVTPKDCFRGKAEQRGKILFIDEVWKTGGGEVEWVIDLPQGSKALKFDISTASGDIELRDVMPAAGSSFNTASGMVILETGEFPGGNLEARSASGTVWLSVNEFGDDFSMKLTRRPDYGEISCPLEITAKETYTEGHLYERNLITRGSGEPEITLWTASGKVIVDSKKTTK